MKQRKLPIRPDLGEFFLLLGFQFIALVAVLSGVVWLGHLAGLRLTSVQPVVALAVVLLLPLVSGEKFFSLPRPWRISAVVIFAAVLGLALLISMSFADVSWDGQAYHGTGILQLLEGWNPIWEPERADAPQALQREVMIHYAKGPWLSAAALCLLADNFEVGKATTLILMAGCFFLALHAAIRFTRLSLWKAAMVAALAALNPISLSQCLTNYVDGQLSMLFTVMVLGSCLALLERRAIYSMLTMLAILLLINVKLTALLYVSVFAACFAGAVWFWKRLDALPSLAAHFAIGISLGLSLGFNPYVTNALATGNPFFPFSLDRIKQGTEQNFEIHQTPVSFRGRTRFETFFRSLFGRCQNDYDFASLTFQGGSLKIPFTVSVDEVRAFRHVDVRVCGWGPLTSGILLFGVVAVGFARGEEMRKFRRIVLALSLCIFATILVIPHPWYARYVPQLWLLPVMAIASLWLAENRSSRILGTGLVALVIVNLMMVSLPFFSFSYSTTRLLRAQLRELAAQDRVYSVFFGDFLVNRLRFREFDIRYQELSARPPQDKQQPFAGSFGTTVLLLEE